MTMLDNLELFHRHNRNMIKLHEERQNANDFHAAAKEAKGYDPVQTVNSSSHGVHFIPLDPGNFDLDVIQKLQHGTTVIHYDNDSGRSVLCVLRLDSSCGAISWHKITYSAAKDSKEKDSMLSKQVAVSASPCSLDPAKISNPPSYSNRIQGPYSSRLEEGELKLVSVKEVETVDDYDLDIEHTEKAEKITQAEKKQPKQKNKENTALPSPEDI
ncbi:hypothetical protein ANCDUO_05762 [Ancylostoma duodenale]|uniref:Uncharacterized protein n=1 Tax=Ancylostoma duodenale TaxID=51022 RepID=A0A0C2GRM0_9BILA|nr:hypothetical protein ANCDUO_05762 [Ancylostoma duodenale]